MKKVGLVIPMSSKQWSKDYPAHITIPPEDAVEIDAILFRLVKKNPPDADDFLASFKDPDQRHLAKKPQFSNQARFYGTSFFKDFESIKGLIDGNPERFDGQLIAEGEIKPDHGKGRLSDTSSHVSMWLYDGVFPLGFVIK
nr:hypothetical protein [Enterobacter hormaechei]